MQSIEVLKKLEKIFREVFDDDSITINRNTTPYDIEEWDSFEHVNLFMAIEQEFGIRFSLEETTKIKSIGEIVDILEKEKMMKENLKGS